LSTGSRQIVGTGDFSSMPGETDQLVQSMAGFGGSSSAAESLTAAALSAADTSQPTLLTTPQHV